MLFHFKQLGFKKNILQTKLSFLQGILRRLVQYVQPQNFLYIGNTQLKGVSKVLKNAIGQELTEIISRIFKAFSTVFRRHNMSQPLELLTGGLTVPISFCDYNVLSGAVSDISG